MTTVIGAIMIFDNTLIDICGRRGAEAKELITYTNFRYKWFHGYYN